jgi:hypothetical protein
LPFGSAIFPGLSIPLPLGLESLGGSADHLG